MTTVEEIARAINRLPLVDRMRVIEQVVHAMTSAMQEKEPAAEDARGTEATLIERGAFLVVDGEGTLPLELFDHRAIREERIDSLADIR
ncbi:MAG: hypothetical protein WCI05_06650 [Myxococcales bacterium]